MKPLRILIITSDYPPRIGGIATFTEGIATALAHNAAIEHVTVLAIQDQAQTTEQTRSTLTIIRCPKRSMIRLFFTLLQYVRRNRRTIDVIHVPNLFPIGFFAVLLQYLFRIPVVVTIHGTDILARAGSVLTKIAKRFTLGHASCVVAVSESTRTLAIRATGLPPERIHVVYYPLPPLEPHTSHESLRQTHKIPMDAVVILSIGNLVKRKGVDDVLRAVALADNPALFLVIVGDGPEEALLRALAEELDIGKQVLFLGRVAHRDDWYDVADLFVLASYHIQEEGDVEGLGIVLLEAAQHGLPVVGTRSGGIPEALEEEETGILVAERNVLALADAFMRLAKDAALRRRMGEAGKRFVARRFDPAHVATQQVALYDALCP